MALVCGCYYLSHDAEFPWPSKQYLALVSSEVHTTVLETTSRTALRQSFINSRTDIIKECVYNFPLYDGVSVVKFVVKVGDKTIYSVVQKKAKARETFDKAVAKGETAGLLAQCNESSDMFSTTLGNIPRGASIDVEITFIGELKHDSEADGIRLTIPTTIAPRYGSSMTSNASTDLSATFGKLEITVDVRIAEKISGIQSSSHPLNVTLETLSTGHDSPPSMNKACVTLSQKSAALDKDFVLIILSKEIDTPKATLETHSTIPNHKALMVTLVPKFQLLPSSSLKEIVFVVDRSGSMRSKVAALISAMQVFLRSLPIGIKFNICSFGSSYSFLWKKSQSYNKESLNEATSHVANFNADFGGTETLCAIRASIENRLQNLPLELVVLTDGDIWNQEELFAYVNSQVTESNGQIRGFPLGIGLSVSSSLIQGLARAGNGFAHHIQDNERFDKSVVRMLKFALSPHITTYQLEIKYSSTNEEDFEIIERVTDEMKNFGLSKKNEETASGAGNHPVSFFDRNSNLDAEVIPQELETDLPDISFPNLLQALHKIPSLFPL